MGHGETALCHVRKTTAQTSLRMRRLLMAFAVRCSDYANLNIERAKAEMYAHAQSHLGF